MKLSDLPRRAVSPLGPWPEASPRLKKLERNYRFRANNRARLAMKERERRAAA